MLVVPSGGVVDEVVDEGLVDEGLVDEAFEYMVDENIQWLKVLSQCLAVSER